MSIMKFKVKPDSRVLGYEEGSIVELDKVTALEFADELELVRGAQNVAYTVPPESRKIEFAFDLGARIILSLQDAGYEECGEIASVSDEDLLALNGIGSGAVKIIRSVLGGGDPISDDPDLEPDESEIKTVELEVE